jgi:hypothetical protein
MTRVILDKETIDRLNGLAEPLVLCDEQGRILGRFTPIAESSLDEAVEPEITEEELKARESETQSYTTAEVLAHLEKL